MQSKRNKLFSVEELDNITQEDFLAFSSEEAERWWHSIAIHWGVARWSEAGGTPIPDKNYCQILRGYYDPYVQLANAHGPIAFYKVVFLADKWFLSKAKKWPKKFRATACESLAA
ncbi:hypothetical protein SAMN05519103_04014 [Rhizobiales bacterium GAS113]|nr:hypothetical protein SAMN05519103_04014 [Rhizobiales bacterium GAS113]